MLWGQEHNFFIGEKMEKFSPGSQRPKRQELQNRLFGNGMYQFNVKLTTCGH